MTPTTRPQAPTSVARDRAAGIGRPGGMFTAAVTAAVVFLAGRQFFAPSTGPEVLSPSPIAQVTPPPAAPEAGQTPATGADATVAADAAAAVAPAPDSAVAVVATKPEKTGEAEPAKSEASDKPAAGEVSQEDKDLARESWRRNKPEVSAADGKSMILVPLKGSSAHASHKYVKKTRTLIVTLPKAASLNTMRFYKLNKEGFANLWTDQEEANAKASDGTKLRLVFTQHAVPEVEIHDEFVRVTIARPSPAKPAPTKAAAPVEKPEPREEAAPSDDKPKPKEKDAD